jgi:ADP-ribose pyrophosphatase YjhB (NUDIX family)
VRPKVRATAILIEDGRLLLVQQRVDDVRHWSLPGGALEAGESLAACVTREVREETGLDVSADRLLYVCDRIEGGAHVVHITFLVHRVGGQLRVGREPETGANQIADVQMVPVASLVEYGFSQRFQELVESGFPGGGTYRGSVSNIGL